MRKALAYVVALSVSFTALACGSSSNDEPGGSGTTDPGPYPEGPYGHDIGQTMPDLKWQGYVNETAEGVATAQPFVEYSMDHVRRSGKPYAFVHISEFF